MYSTTRQPIGFRSYDRPTGVSTYPIRSLIILHQGALYFRPSSLHRAKQPDHEQRLKA
ncbi:hypothetical protein PGT21_034014 [Puccinia graminis f. sp. tritici]|uniref:Uncharacterized protein n=1 Tax=Puccinia graminis f. sp. tritici TaxID=56615 RepID=A0A5B0PCK7_PUCGR|nr:hypothetical protein PGT21_034014 [Puccinia graminis f. sp. tritici]